MLLRPRPAGSRSAGFFTAHRAVELALLRPERWCERGDSNPHPLRDQILSLARLPIPPLSRSFIIRQVIPRALIPGRNQTPLDLSPFDVRLLTLLPPLGHMVLSRISQRGRERRAWLRRTSK